ncbi:hypothetical protein BELL_0071g00040 [Botrytis elliptica]|uniref:Uncharacterized protein n=1 Tax=Botrytis elliptica TaxID=278938 RepID=A0A4Z1JXC4_9HELO|nr:hypothetical protein EAE99_011833 [Botrytis elliptica]TGO78285.1 hypothetical protein BELL_0071g00040 [Botrytis elliptica]
MRVESSPSSLPMGDGGRGRENDNNDTQQPDVVPGSMINATGHGESLQIAQVSDSAGFSPNVGPQNTDAPEPQEGEIENFDADRHDLCAINATEVEAASSETKENRTQGSGNFSLKRDSLQSQVSSEYALDLFITDPNSYSREITVLEHRILQLGPDAFKEIKEDNETRRYVLPLRHLDAGLDFLTPFSPTSDQPLRINGYIQLQVSMSIETLSSIIAGTRLLKHEGFCNSSTYNIVVADIDRPRVLDVRPVSMPSLSLLLEILCEVQEFAQQKDNQQRDSALEDVAEILLHIVPRHREFELGTRPPKWKMNERTAQASGGQYLTITLGFTYKFDAGWTLKDVILEDWVNAGKTDASHIPNRYLVDCLAVLDFSCCSGHARRISLWALLRDSATRGYLYQKFNDGVEEFRDITSLLDGLGSIDSLSSIWTTISVAQRKLLIFSFKTISKILKFTGIGEDKKLQAWDITSHDRIDGRRLDPRWSSFVKDDGNSATFVVITSTCIRYSQSNDQALTDTVLQTQLCITAAQRINRSLAAPEKDAEMQGTQSNSSATFSSRWAVNRSRPIDVKCRQSADRYQTMKNDSGQPPPVNQSDPEDKLLDRIRNNQRKRQIVSNAASQPSCTGDDPSILASQHPSNNPSPSRKRPKTGTCDMPPSIINHAPILSIRNSLCQKVGKLSVEPAIPIDLTLLTEKTTLQAKWKEVTRMNIIGNLKEKEAQLNQTISTWARKSNGFIPSLIGRIAPSEEDSGPPDVVEYIRPGNLMAYQKLINVYIH